MKKKLCIITIMLLAVLAVLFLPIPGSSCDDGGSREYTALTYKIVDWNRMTADGIYQKTCIYWGTSRSKSLDELWQLEAHNAVNVFLGQIVKLEADGNALIRPLDGEHELLSADRIRIALDNSNGTIAKVGDYLKITYTGPIMESYPAQINMVSYEFTEDLRNIIYNGQWLDKDKAEQRESSWITTISISRIYENCFMAYHIVSFPVVSDLEEIKINGSLSPDWCVGDQMRIQLENVWYEAGTHRFEADLVSIVDMDLPLPRKPVIYLYPKITTEISVKLPINGHLTCTYPAYRDGWNVTAQPDGTLTDQAGMTYSYLYWEGVVNTKWDMSKGFCIPGYETAAFLETALAQLGLNRKEANEFIVYWLPLMQDNPYNIISFQDKAYTDAAPLQISPSPDTCIRVFMTWQPCATYVKMTPQELTAPQRTGFTVVEWGGTEVE